MSFWVLSLQRLYTLFTVDERANAMLRLFQLISIIFATFMYSGGREGKRAVRAIGGNRDSAVKVRGGEVARNVNGVLGRAEGADVGQGMPRQSGQS